MLSLRPFFWSIRRLYSLLCWSFQALSQASVRVSGILLFLGGLIATGGYVVASLNPSPLAPTWVPSSWVVILGVLVLVAGMLGLYLQYLLRPGIIGRFGVMMLMLGTLVLVTGAVTVDIFFLPWMFKLIDALSGLNGQMQTAINQAMSGINSATSSLGNAMGNGCKLAGQICNSTPVPSTLLSINSQSMVNKLLSQIGLASLDTLKICGLAFLSGIPLSLGCLLLGLTFLRAGLKSRMALLILICCAFLNLATLLPILGILFPGLLGGLLANLSSFFLSHLSFLNSFSGALLFLPLAWLGFTLWFPWKLQIHLPWQNALLDTKIYIQKTGGWFKRHTSGQVKKM
jgi:hypothetical protein